MTSSGVRITKNDRRKLQQIIRDTPRKADELVRGAAQEMTNEIVLSFGVSPSAPGDPPGVDTDTLRGSMDWTPDGQFRALIHDGTEYGIYLEDGTENMAPRPFINPVFDDWRRRQFALFAVEFGIIS